MMLEKEIYELNKKYFTYMNISEDDKKRFREIVSWTGELFELTVKEKYAKNIFPKRGEVWTCAFGINPGSEINNVRPAIIISNNIGNKNAPIVTVLPITKREERQCTHVRLEQSSFSYMEDSIKGTAIAEQIRTVSKARLGRKIGELTPETMKKIEEAIMIALGKLEATNEEVH